MDTPSFKMNQAYREIRQREVEGLFFARTRWLQDQPIDLLLNGFFLLIYRKGINQLSKMMIMIKIISQTPKYAEIQILILKWLDA